MPTLSMASLPPPKSWDEFEEIYSDLARQEWGDPGVVRHGKSGQPQQGVDVSGVRASTQQTIGAQCKVHLTGAKLTWSEVEAEVKKAEGFSPALAEYEIATTASRDAEIQRQVRELN